MVANSTVLLKLKLNKREGRKLYMEGTMHDENGALLADATCLFILVKPTVNQTSDS